MAKQFSSIEPAHSAFIARQHIFFTASATSGSRVNLSPKDAAAFRVLGPNEVAYLDQTGSGAETAAHLRADGRLTIMFCSFEGPPLILRLYGRGRTLPYGGDEFRDLLVDAFDGEERPGARQIVVLAVELVQTSCGFGVPLFEHQGDRDVLTRWAASKTAAEMSAYRAQKNRVSIDGLPTGIVD